MEKYLYNLAIDKYKGIVPGIIKVFLFLLSLVYGLIIKGLIFFYSFRQNRLNAKVISVGNITVGGTGKTPLVEYLAKYLKQQGHKVAVLSRGYKKKITHRESRIANRESRATNSATMGDEPYMLSEKLGDIPVIVDADRIKAAKRGIKDYGADTVILDDGFQQWGIIKDLEIVTIDTTNPFGNRHKPQGHGLASSSQSHKPTGSGLASSSQSHLIPRGLLREPLSCLSRADIFVLTKTNLGAAVDKLRDILTKINPKALIVESIHKPVGLYNMGTNKALQARPAGGDSRAGQDDPSGRNEKKNSLMGQIFGIDMLKGKCVTVFSGIGDPDSFEDLIVNLGAEISLSFQFPDHHIYTEADLNKIIKSSLEKGIDTVITTEKDAARLQASGCRLQAPLILALRIELTITKDEQRFSNRLLELYSF